MKNEEDEAFEDIERRQGGGFPAKRAAATDKLQEPVQEQEEDWGALAEKQLASIKRDTQASLEDAMVRATHKVMAEFEAQPAQEPPSEWAGIKAILDEYGLQAIDFVADFKAALAGREWNFCERCGKRTADLTVIHTCTPPQEKNA